jgi:hypothetical protein
MTAKVYAFALDVILAARLTNAVVLASVQRGLCHEAQTH